MCGLNRRIGPQRAHGDPDIGSGQDRRIVDPLTHKNQLAFAFSVLLQLFHLLMGKQLRSSHSLFTNMKQPLIKDSLNVLVGKGIINNLPRFAVLDQFGLFQHSKLMGD